MICPYCSLGIHFEATEETDLVPLISGNDEPGSDAVDVGLGHCPNCDKLIAMMQFGKISKSSSLSFESYLQSDESRMVYPFQRAGRQINIEVPVDLAALFRKSEQVLPISPEASATLSRRILQQVFHDYLSIKLRDLNQEIDEFIKRPGVPTYLRDSVDGIRTTGNYAAHPVKYQSSGEMIDVEEGEAEWSLDTLESLFDFVFVQPKKLEEQRKKLNTKNALAGKPPLKGV